jgi:hypothetical protein
MDKRFTNYIIMKIKTGFAGLIFSSKGKGIFRPAVLVENEDRMALYRENRKVCP